MFADVSRRFVVCLLFALPVAAQTVLVGSGTSTTASARVMENGGEVNEVLPTPAHTAGVTVAHGDVNGDSFPDIITGAAGGSSLVQVFNGTNNAQLHYFSAYDLAFTGGVFVAAADVNEDGHDDIVTGAGAGGAPRVRVFDGVTGSVLHDFLAYASGFTGGVRVAAADHDGDKRADIITAPGAGSNLVKVFSGVDGAELTSFTALPGVTGGIFVAAGDLDEDGHAEVVAGAGNGEPDVIVYRGDTNGSLTGFAAFALTNTSGVRVGVVMNDQDSGPYIVAGTGSGVQTTVKTFSWPSLAVDDTFTPYGANNTGGVYVAGFDTRPTATIVNTAPVCFPDPIRVELTGRGLGNWTLTWSDGVVTQALGASFEREVHVPGTYTITNVEDLNHSSGFASGSATVTDQGGPVFSTHPQTQTIPSGQKATLTASATGGSVFYRWYEDHATNPGFKGSGSTFQTPSLTQTTRFFVVASNDTCSRVSQTATVHVVPLAPTGLIASAASATSVTVDWNNVIGAASYDVYRNSGAGFVFVATTTASFFTDTGRTAGTSHLYRVIAKTAENVASGPSASDIATTVLFTDPTLTAGTTKAKAVHINELRTAINAARSLAGLAPGTHSNASLTAGEKVEATDVSELRTQLNAARSALSLPTLTFDDSTLTAGTTKIKAVHVQQLRNGVM